MSVYTVKAATLKREVPAKPGSNYGPSVVYSLTLDDGQNSVFADWFTKANTPLPQFGDQLEGDVAPNNFGGQDFKKSRPTWGGGGGGGPRPRDPQERRSIQLQHAQKVGAEVAKIAVEAGLWKPSSPTEITAAVTKVARALYDQIEDVTAA